MHIRINYSEESKGFTASLVGENHTINLDRIYPANKVFNLVRFATAAHLHWLFPVRVPVMKQPLTKGVDFCGTSVMAIPMNKWQVNRMAQEYLDSMAYLYPAGRLSYQLGDGWRLQIGIHCIKLGEPETLHRINNAMLEGQNGRNREEELRILCEEYEKLYLSGSVEESSPLREGCQTVAHMTLKGLGAYRELYLLQHKKV